MSSECKDLVVANGLNPIVRVILQGVYDAGCILSMLHGMPHILKTIWEIVKVYWKKHIKICQDEKYFQLHNQPVYDHCYKAYSRPWGEESLTFPSPTNLNINMMPFVVNKKFNKCLLPHFIKPYWHIIEQCIILSLQNNNNEIGKIWFLTIQESFVKKDTSQRRPGLHTESPGVLYIKDDNLSTSRDLFLNEAETVVEVQNGGGFSEVSSIFAAWGRGVEINEVIKGGIFMASNIAESCKIWNCEILPCKNGTSLIGELGNIEHLREFLPKGEIMEKNVMYWLTDRTPHESLPLPENSYRQYVRIVTSEVSLWFEDHSTRNPLGVVPNSTVTKIVKGSKFNKKPLTLKK